MRQITFELLRHGPTHNQLLSPLTQYLALCENHAAVTVQVPFEHNQFLHRLRALSYQLGTESRAFQVKDTARVLGDMLGEVPGLIAELNRESQDTAPAASFVRRDPQRFTHLRVISSAAELALLPFELALTPNGFPGAGQSLLLQSQEPICLTREVRRVPEQYLRWPKNPRVLFVAASPPGVNPIPFDVHRSVLRECLAPWVAYAESDKDRERLLEQHLVVVTEASCDDIQRLCADGEFSHVHILAHGVQYQDGYDTRFGLALHDPNDPSKLDPVSGDRLATILRPAQSPSIGGLAKPIVVTLAACDSGNVGGVVGAGVGASLAHALHAVGIPMVVASQFPLSIPASNIFVKVLYSGLLWGEDPRISLHDLRRRLHSTFPATHDWASVTAFLSLPGDFERRLTDIQIDQTMRSIEVALNDADRATTGNKRPGAWPPPAPAPGASDPTLPLKHAKERVEKGRQRLEALLVRTRDQKARVFGLLAATEKRCSEVYYSMDRGRTQETVDWPRLLQKARGHYWDVFLHDRESSWAVVQYLSLSLLFEKWKREQWPMPVERHDEHNNPHALWTLARVLSTNDLRTKEEQRIRWAQGNLTELCLLGLLFDEPPAGFTPEKLRQAACDRAQDLVDRAGPASFEVYSTRRQILRYVDWYPEIADIPTTQPTAQAVLGILPDTERLAGE